MTETPIFDELMAFGALAQAGLALVACLVVPAVLTAVLVDGVRATRARRTQLPTRATREDVR